MGEISKEILINIQNKYEKVCTLFEDSRRDLPTEPYNSKSAAADILAELKHTITKLIEEVPQENIEEKRWRNSMLAAVWLLLGSISSDIDALSASAEELSNAVTLVSNSPLDPVSIIVHICALNQLGILWSRLEQPEKSKRYLEKAEKLYLEYTAQDNIPNVYDIDDLFKREPSKQTTEGHKNTTPLEKNHTLTLYYLAQVYGALEDNLKSAVYCHNTLRRQLESEDYDPIDWALNSATLSQYFMERGGFKQARHHLAAASLILDRYQEELKSSEEENAEVIAAREEQFRHRGADVARCWSKYGLLLLGASKDRLMLKADAESEDELQTTTDLTVKPLTDKAGNPNDGTSKLVFHSLAGSLDPYESQITDDFVLDFDDAARVFVTTKQWIEEAQRYYTLDEHATDYSHIVQDLSGLYQVMVFFEEDPKRQCRLHKRRLDMLDTLQSSLNAQCYMSVCRQLWFELGEVCWEMLHIKLTASKDAGTDISPDPHTLNKINSLTNKSIHYFGLFLGSLTKQGLGPGEKPYEADMVRPALMAHFYRGRLFVRFITPQKESRVENNRKSLEAFKFIVDYCTKYPEAAKMMSEELASCKEMVELLPLKIHRLAELVEQSSLTD